MIYPFDSGFFSSSFCLGDSFMLWITIVHSISLLVSIVWITPIIYLSFLLLIDIWVVPEFCCHQQCCYERSCTCLWVHFCTHFYWAYTLGTECLDDNLFTYIHLKSLQLNSFQKKFVLICTLSPATYQSSVLYTHQNGYNL